MVDKWNSLGQIYETEKAISGNFREEIIVTQLGFQCKWNIRDVHVKATVGRVNKIVNHDQQVRSTDQSNLYFGKYSSGSPCNECFIKQSGYKN